MSALKLFMSDFNLSRGSKPIPFYRDSKKLAVLVQVLFLLFVIALVFVVVNNVRVGLQKKSLSFSFGFLNQVAGFQVAEGTAFGIPYDSEKDNYTKVILVGLYNTLRVSIVGMVLATVLGLLVGIARLSSNWLVSRIALVYVEILRNTPLLVQLIVWYFIFVLNALPQRKQAWQVLGAYFSNSGAWLPWMVQQPDKPNFFPVQVLAFFVGLIVYVLLLRRNRNLERPTMVWPQTIGAGLATLLLGFFVLGQPLAFELPRKTNFGLAGGLEISPEFIALLLGLVVYTSSFIAEIVRAGIQAVPKGQWEAARAVGLGYTQALQLIILPQALRVIIPPLGNQYLNLTKNSSLAVAVGYADLLNVLNTSGNQSGQNLQAIVIAGFIYLILSLIISALVNWYNTATKVVTR